jgi:hypothetical protein
MLVAVGPTVYANMLIEARDGISEPAVVICVPRIIPTPQKSRLSFTGLLALIAVYDLQVIFRYISPVVVPGTAHANS